MRLRRDIAGPVFRAAVLAADCGTKASTSAEMVAATTARVALAEFEFKRAIVDEQAAQLRLISAGKS